MEKWKVPTGMTTHVSMNGGSFYVPNQDTLQFYETCISLIKTGTRLYMVEKKTELFRFFIDFDYKSPEKLEDEDLLQFCSIIHGTIPGRCLIAKTRARTIGAGLIKTGAHIHWPDLIVNKTEALNLRSKLILALGEGPWDSVIDSSVYSGSGLRMIWSHKKPTGDPYFPWLGTDSDGKFTQTFSKEPNVETLALFAIRTEDVPRPNETLDNNDSLEKFIQRYLEGQKRATVKKVQRHEHDGWFVQTDSKWCLNIHREHKSNHVWFSIHSGCISQKCLDEECNGFQGPKTILPPSIVEKLQDVAIVGSPSHSFLMDIFPDESGGPIQKIRAPSSPVFGSRSGKLEPVSSKYENFRTIGFNI